jgi:short-subunit dehydrogenase
VLCPGTTATNFFAVAGALPTGLQARRMMTADAVARIAYAGMARRQRVTIAGIMNRILAFGATHTPHFLTLPVAQRLLTEN